MKKITNSAIKYWDKMWKAWRRNKLGSPLNELATYCNYMANGHYAYFSQFKKEYQFKYNLFVLKDFLPEKHYNNLIDAREIYDTYPNKKELSKIEEMVFAKVDDIYFDNIGFVESIIFEKLNNGEFECIPNAYRFIKIKQFFIKLKNKRK